jgi:putative isomerase
MRRTIQTEDPDLNAVLEKLYAECVCGKLVDPLPPALPYRWFTPGGRYVGQWLWDTMFVLAAYGPLDRDGAIRDSFANYWYTLDHNPEAPEGSDRYGMVPNYLREWPPVAYSQIPILGWGCRLLEQQMNDPQLARQALPYLVRFDDWYDRQRDTDGDGLIEYGAYRSIGKFDLVQTARFESFDLQPTTKGMRLTERPGRQDGQAFYGNREGVEQTCFLIMSEEAMARIAQENGQTDLADRLEATIARRAKAIQEKMWDAKTQFFYTLDRDSDRRQSIRSLQGFLTLTAGVATAEQAAALVRQLQDPAQWWCPYPVPTVALDDPTFKARGYWQGDMWPATTYLVTRGLHRYGYHDIARQITRKNIDLIRQQGVNEHYDPITGKPLGIPGIGMTAAVVSMVVESLYGIQSDFRTICVPPQAQGRRLLFGKIEVRYPDNNTVIVRSAFERRMRVEFPEHAPGGRLSVRCDGEPLSPEQAVVSGLGVTFTAAAKKEYAVSFQPPEPSER